MDSEEWIVKSGEWRVESGEWRVESGEWRVESGEWRVESGEWRVESGEWRVESDLSNALGILSISAQSFNKCAEVSGVSNSSLAESMTILASPHFSPGR